MEPITGTTGKPSFFRNIMTRVLIFGVLIIVIRFAYIVTLAGETCNLGDFCFFELPENLNNVITGNFGNTAVTTANKVIQPAGPIGDNLYTSKDWIRAVNFYSSVFQDLISEGYLSPEAKSLCVETQLGQDVFALREIGVKDSIGTFKKAFKPLVMNSKTTTFDENSFDFVFSGQGGFDKVLRPLDLAGEIVRLLKPEGFVVVHVKAKDDYSFNSFIELFNDSCKFIKSRDVENFREIVLQKIVKISSEEDENVSNSINKCAVPEQKRELVRKAEVLIEEEPLKPWITLKRNIRNVKYLPTMADISFKNRYVYVDVGARSYGSSIGSWFKKQYPKQNRTFDVYAIEADRAFYDEYKTKKGITLLPYAAWVRNESLTFEINHDPGKEVKDRGRGMGRIQPVTKEDSNGLESDGSLDGEVDTIKGFDFAEWLKSTVTEKDFVVVKMDVEGTEFDLIPRLFETGAICLIDEIFLECHYNRWQRCCPGQRSTKYEKTYGECLELFTSLRESGVLVHQWF